MTTKLRDKTVEELDKWALSFGNYARAFDELARRLGEAEQKIAEWDAMLDEFQAKLKTTVDYLVRYHRHRNNGGREVWDTDAAHAAYESCMECIAYLPASAKANSEVIKK